MTTAKKGRFDYVQFGKDIAELAKAYIDRHLVNTESALQKRMADMETRIASGEHKSTRHAEHLQRLETRVQRLGNGQ